MLCATSARAYVVGVLAGVRKLSHQLGNGYQLAEQVPGPWQLLQTLQFGCSSLVFRRAERIALGTAPSPAALSKSLGIIHRHQYASCKNDVVLSRGFPSQSAER
jgi:hypothetical protein